MNSSDAVNATYQRGFFAAIRDGSWASAKEVVPYVMEQFHPRSVADVGCGTGAWLSVFRDHGVPDIQGFDGDYVDRQMLMIPAERFQAADVGKPLSIGRRFDLALSVEVGEHLDAAFAPAFVDNLVALSDVIVFSAAIPGQGGNHHVNEQWPDYWKALFEQRGYVMIDGLRWHFWNNPKVESWYRQNLFYVIQKDRLKSLPKLLAEHQKFGSEMFPVVHPATFDNMPFLHVLRMVPLTFMKSVQRRLRRRTLPTS